MLFSLYIKSGMLTQVETQVVKDAKSLKLC